MSVAIEFLHTYRLEKSEFEKIPEDQRACIGLMSHAVTEINVMHKAYIFSDHDITGMRDVDAAITAQKTVLLRCWSAKLFEFEEFLKFQGRHNRTKDPTLLRLAAQSRAEFSVETSNVSRNLVKAVRDEATNHYCLKPARKNLKFLRNDANTTFLVHQMSGNGFYPLGEELMFAAQMERFGVESADAPQLERIFSDWMAWNLSASSCVSGIFSKFIQKIVFERFPEKFAVKKDYWVPHELVGKKSERLTPVFYRGENA